MAYNPIGWVDGETPINAENLNHMDEGIKASVKSINGTTPDENGNVEIESGSENIPAAADVDDTGLVSFKNAAGLVLFTLDLSDVSGASFGELVISADNLKVSENGSNTFTVALATAPTANQPVYLAVSDNTKISVSPSTLTFTTTNWAEAQTVTVTAAQDDDKNDESIIVTLTSRKVSAKQITVAVTDTYYVPELVTDGLVFNLELRGRTAENDPANPPTITDTVGGLVCTPCNIDWDGETSGFVENGLLLKDYSSLASPNQYNETTYSTLGVPPLPDVDFTNGVTIEICANPEKQNIVRFFAGTANGATLYLSIYPGSAGSYAQSFTDINGSNNAGLYTAYGSSASFYDGTGYNTGEHIYTYTYSPAGVLSHYLDGVFLGSMDYNSKGDFDHFNLPDVLKTMKAGYIGSFENGTKDRQMVVSEYRMYNRVLSADEIADNYKVTLSRQTATNF